MSEKDDEKKKQGEAILRYITEKFPYPWERERREKRRAQAARLCACTGVWGMVTGIAVFITVEHAPNKGVLGVELLTAGLAAVIVEWLRGKAASHEDKPVSLPNLVSMILMFCTFEMFIFAVHTLGKVTAEKKWGEIVHTIFGVGLDSEVIGFVPRTLWNLAAFVGLWILLGGLLAFILGRAIDKLPRENLNAFRCGLIAGVQTGLIAPLIVFGYGLVVRLSWAGWVFSKTGYWPFTGENLWQYLLPLGFFAWLISAFCGKVKFTASSVLYAVLLGVRLVKSGLGLGVWEQIVQSTFDTAWKATPVWGVPAIVLGLFLPLLRHPSDFRRLWSPLAMGIAALSLAIAFYEQQMWLGIGAVIFFAMSLVFRHPRHLEDCWPLLGACTAMVAFIVAVAWHHATGLDIYHNLQTVINTPSVIRVSDDDLKALKTAERQTKATDRIAALTMLRDTMPDRQQDTQRQQELERRLRPLVSLDTLKLAQERAIAIGELQPDFRSYIEARLAFECQLLGDDQHKKSGIAPHGRTPCVDRALPAAHAPETSGKPLSLPQQKPEYRPSRAFAFELATMGSLTFWVTLGLLAAWQKYEKET